MSVLSTPVVADTLARLFARVVRPTPKPGVCFPDIPADTEEITIGTGHGDTAATVYRPAGRPDGVYVNVHGGGFVVGADDEGSDALVRRLCADLRRGVEADAYRQSGDGKKAYDTYGEALKIASHDATLWNDFGLLLKGLGKIGPAFDAFVATGDVVGACPMLEIVSPYDAEDPRIKVTRDICGAYSGRSAAALRQLERKRQQGVLSRTEMLLAQRYAGAGGSTRRAVNIEWDGTDELTPFAYSLAVATGLDVPDSLRAGAGRYYAMVDATSPALALEDRASSSWFAAANGVLSSQAMVDLLSIAYGTGDTGTVLADRAEVLRRAYVAADPEERMSALRTLWSADVNAPYGTRVATAYAAARMPVDEAFADDADELVAAMLAAGLDRNALRWTGVVENGSKAWAMLALVNPQRDAVSVGEVGDSDHATRLFVAGLAGLGRASDGLARDYDIDLARQTRWTRAISGAADSGSAPLVALLAGLGMQGDSWAKMTPLHLYHIVRALDRVGLSAEARMIAAEAVARG